VPRQGANAYFTRLLAGRLHATRRRGPLGATMAPPGRVALDGSYYIDRLPKDMNMASAPHTVLLWWHPARSPRSAFRFGGAETFQDGDTSEPPAPRSLTRLFARQAFRDSDPLGRVIFCPWDSSDPMIDRRRVVGDVRSRACARGVPECYSPICSTHRQGR